MVQALHTPRTAPGRTIGRAHEARDARGTREAALPGPQAHAGLRRLTRRRGRWAGGAPRRTVAAGSARSREGRRRRAGRRRARHARPRRRRSQGYRRRHGGRGNSGTEERTRQRAPEASDAATGMERGGMRRLAAQTIARLAEQLGLAGALGASHDCDCFLCASRVS
eukprot:5184234-Pleurochrysis_carterae.AAC.2